MSHKNQNLTHAKLIQVVDWIRANREQLLKERPNEKRLATLISAGTTIAVSVGQVRRYADMAGVTWLPRDRDGTNQPPVAHLHRRVNYLAQCMRRMYEACGEAIPPDFDQVFGAGTLLPEVPVSEPTIFNTTGK